MVKYGKGGREMKGNREKLKSIEELCNKIEEIYARTAENSRKELFHLKNAETSTYHIMFIRKMISGNMFRSEAKKTKHRNSLMI